MGSVAGAEPPAVVPGLTDGHAAQVCADTHHDEPFGLLDALGVCLGIAQGLHLDGVGLLNLVGCAVTDEDGLAAPLDDDVLALRDGGEVHFHLRHG